MGCCDWLLVVMSYLVVLLTLPLSIWRCIKVINKYECAVIFRLGRVRGGNKGPGLVFVLPCTDSLMKVNIRTNTFIIPPQEVWTEDFVRLWVDGVVCYRVQNAAKCVTNVTDVHAATPLLASTTVRNVLGTKSLSEILSDQEEVIDIIQSTLQSATDDWGIEVQRVDIRTSGCPQQHEVQAAAAETNRSQLMQQASVLVREFPSALRQRYM